VSATVRSVEVAADRALVTVHRAVADPAAGQALLDVAFCGICGSDLHFRDVPELFPAGTVPGHELSGRITALGPGVDGWAIGDRVCVLPFAQCGDCELCRSGNEQVCPRAIAEGVGLGTGRPGAYAEQILVDERMLFALPDTVDDRAGTVVEPLAVAIRAVGKAGVTPADAVVVIGTGPVGLLTGFVLRAQGFEDFVVISRNPARGQRAADLGLPVVALNDGPDAVRGALGRDPAAAFECAGTPAAAQLAVDLVAPLGRVMLVGVSMAPLDLPAPPIVMKEVQLNGVLTYRRDEFAHAIDLLARGAIPVDDLITAIAPLEDAESAFQSLTAPGNTNVKVLLQP